MREPGLSGPFSSSFSFSSCIHGYVYVLSVRHPSSVKKSSGARALTLTCQVHSDSGSAILGSQ